MQKAASRQHAAKVIAEKCAEALKLLGEAERLALKHKLEFDFEVVYGMGGTFYGDAENSYNGVTGWTPSSHTC